MTSKPMILLIGSMICISGALQSQKPFLFSNANPLTLPRSQSTDAVRELAGWQQYINKTDAECSYQSFSFTVQYERSFRANRIAECLFGNSVSFYNSKQDAVLNISGSHVAARNAEDWLADYFGLPTDFQSQVQFIPTIENALFDFNFYAGLDSWHKGTFFRIHAPLVWTKWHLNACENILNPGTNNYDPGYMNGTPNVPFGATCPVGILNENLQKSFLVATDGCHGTFGDVTQDFKFGIIGNGNTCNKNRYHRVGLADIELAAGWNFLRNDDYHVGLEIRGSIPTGNYPNPQYLFYPIVGNGHYWALGGGLTSHCILWRNCDNEHLFGLWFDVNLMHLFKNCQKRSFDFKNKPNSRYMLLEQLNKPVLNLFGSTTAGATGVATAPIAQYRGPGNLFHAINTTTREIYSGFSWQSDLALKFAYQFDQFELDIGFGAWSRTAETVCARYGVPAQTYAVKGDAYIYGYASDANTAGLASGTPVPLSATENAADITGGFNFYGSIPLTQGQQNGMIDNARFAQDVPMPASINDALLNIPVPAVGTCSAVQTQTSVDPIFVSTNDIDFHGIQEAFTHKVFIFLSYNADQERDIVPFGGLGVGFEVAPGIGDDCTFTDSDEDNNGCGISQWTIWARLGVAY